LNITFSGLLSFKKCSGEFPEGFKESFHAGQSSLADANGRPLPRIGAMACCHRRYAVVAGLFAVGQCRVWMYKS